MVKLEYLLLELRDITGIPFKPEEEIKKLDVKRGGIILDFGCGTGSYTLPVAKVVGREGKVYALDREPLALRRVEEKARREGLVNIHTILSDEDTSLPDESIDIILFYGVIHQIRDKYAVLKELYRVLKPTGYLSTRYCLIIKKDKVIKIMEQTKLFSLIEEKGKILNFQKRL